MKDLFKKLIKLTGNKEDFFTECLAAALRSDRVLAGEFIGLILGNDFNETKEKNIDIKIDTQVKYDKGRSIPDLVISANTWTLCIENKLLAYEGKGQLRKYLELGVFNSLAFITASGGYHIEKCVLDNPVYRRPHSGDHFVWEDVYPIFEKAAKAPGSHPVLLAMHGLFVDRGLKPTPQIDGLFPLEKWTREQIRGHYKPFWAPTKERLARGGWEKFEIHSHLKMAQMYVKTCPHPQIKMVLLEAGTKECGTPFVKATVTLHSHSDLVSFADALKERLQDQLPSAEVYHQSKKAKNVVFIVSPLHPFVENLMPIQIHKRLADHFGGIVDVVSSVMVGL